MMRKREVEIVSLKKKFEKKKRNPPVNSFAYFTSLFLFSFLFPFFFLTGSLFLLGDLVCVLHGHHHRWWEGRCASPQERDPNQGPWVPQRHRQAVRSSLAKGITPDQERVFTMVEISVKLSNLRKIHTDTNTWHDTNTDMKTH